MAGDGKSTREQENSSNLTFQMYIENGTLPTVGDIKKIFPKVNAKWMQTFTEQAKVLKTDFVKNNKGYNYSRDTGIMPYIENLAKTYCGVEGGSRIFATKDTWNPMDVVMVKKSKEEEFKKIMKELVTIKGVTEKGNLSLLNSFIFTALQSKDMIPISLKKIKLEQGVDLEVELNTGNPEKKDWKVLNPKCLLNIKDRVFENSEFSMHFQLVEPPAYKIKVQVRNRRLSQPNGTVQSECINESKSGAKLGTVPADLIETFLSDCNLTKPYSISKHPQIPQKFPGDWTEPQLQYWISKFNRIEDKLIGGKKVEWGTLSVTGEGSDDSGIDSVIRNGAGNESAIQYSNFGRFRNILVSLEYIDVMQSLTEKGKLNDFLNVIYYGAKKAFDPLNGSFIKIF